MTTRPTTPRAALLEFAEHLETAPDGATWLPPRSVATLIREHAERYPVETSAPPRTLPVGPSGGSRPDGGPDPDLSAGPSKGPRR